ncbi:MAG: hypothetical protein HC876_07805 [Chloroflexaceae bacterium]|nr:hypothetical protein [Chloroflexaceae bacterium]
MAERQRLMVIDGHALTFRAFHAMANANLRTSSGEPTYAVFGFLQIMLTNISEYRPHYVAVTFDVGRTFRDDMYAEYKAGRTETPAEFHPQLDRIKQALDALCIPIYTADGYEADDVIGTLARQATAQQIETLILTGDTDTLQLVDDYVKVLLANPYTKRTTASVYGEAEVLERYDGLRPDQLADLRGLKGDPSDNIPGVKGIGEKGAITLLNEFGTVENLYDHLDEVPNRYRKHLDGQREQALFSKQLSIIVCDAPVTLDIDAARLGGYNRATVIELFQSLEFGKSLVDKLPTSAGAADVQALPVVNAKLEPVATTGQPASFATELPAGSSFQMALFDLPPAEVPVAAVAAPTNPNLGTYRTATTAADLDDLILELNSAPGFAFDVESTGLSPLTDTLVGLSLSTRPGTGWYIPVGHVAGEQLPRQEVFNRLRPYFTDPHKPKYAHNAKFDMELLQEVGIPVQGLVFDVLLAAKLLGHQRSGLKELGFYELRLPEPMTEIEELIGRGAKQTTFDQVPIERAAPYAAADADVTLRLVAHFQQRLQDEPHSRAIFEQLEMPLIPILIAMESAGIGINLDYMHELNERLSNRIAELEKEIYGHAGQEFNINSGVQLNEILFDKLGLPTDGLKKHAARPASR